MFDSVHIECPKCKRDLEFQSKSGPCGLFSFDKDNLPVEVAVGINGDVVMCEFCKINWQVDCHLPEKIENITLTKTDREKDYSGNFNSQLPDNIKRAEDLKKLMEERKNDN